MQTLVYGSIIPSINKPILFAEYQTEEKAKLEAWEKLSPEQQQAYLDEKERQHREYMAKFDDQEQDENDDDEDDDDDQSDEEID